MFLLPLLCVATGLFVCAGLGVLPARSPASLTTAQPSGQPSRQPAGQPHAGRGLHFRSSARRHLSAASESTPGANVVRRTPLQARAPAKPDRSWLGKHLTVALASPIAAVAFSVQPNVALVRRTEPVLLSLVAPDNVVLAAVPASAQRGATPVVQMSPPRVAAWDVFGRLQRLEDTIFTKEDANKKFEEMEARMDKQFYVTTAISIVVPFVMLIALRPEVS